MGSYSLTGSQPEYDRAAGANRQRKEQANCDTKFPLHEEAPCMTLLAAIERHRLSAFSAPPLFSSFEYQGECTERTTAQNATECAQDRSETNGLNVLPRHDAHEKGRGDCASGPAKRSTEEHPEDGHHGHGSYNANQHHGCTCLCSYGLTKKLSSSQPTTSPYRRTLSRVCSNAWFGMP
jgi:hypothetical protein